jgi:hypothetical protein
VNLPRLDLFREIYCLIQSRGPVVLLNKKVPSGLHTFTALQMLRVKMVTPEGLASGRCRMKKRDRAIQSSYDVRL